MTIGSAFVEDSRKISTYGPKRMNPAPDPRSRFRSSVVAFKLHPDTSRRNTRSTVDLTGFKCHAVGSRDYHFPSIVSLGISQQITNG